MDDQPVETEASDPVLVRRPPALLGRVEFGDDAIEVQEFPDGICLITNGDGRTQVNQEQLQEVVGMFNGIRKQKGWL